MLLDNMGLLGNIRLANYFPLVFTFYGVMWLARCRRLDQAVLPGIMIAGGILGTLGNLRLLHFSAHDWWPLILIAVGLSLLFRRSRGWDGGRWAARRGDRERFRFGGEVHIAGAAKSASNAPAIDENAVFSEIKRVITSQEFTGGSGAGHLRLCEDRHAIRPRWGWVHGQGGMQRQLWGIEFRIPETWRVIWEGAASFGAFHDKTVPPRPEAGVTPPTLVLTGQAAFGGIEVRN